MILDLAAEASIETIETDVAIIGSGPAGISLASRLKRDCCVIESGGLALDIRNHWRFHSVNAGDQTNVDSLRVRGVGGASLRWTGRCIALDPYDFEDRPWIAESSWPIDYEDLVPWFESAGDLMELQSADILERFPSKDLENIMASDGRWRPCVWRFADDRAHGMFRFGVRMAPVFKSETRHLFYHAHCAQILADAGKVRGLLLVTESGRQVTVKARHIVIAAGCVESSRLMLDTHRTHPALLGSVEPWLGRGFNQHLRVDAGQVHLSPSWRRPLQKQTTIFRRKGVTLAERGLAIDPDFARRERIGNASLNLRFERQEGPSVSDFWARVRGRVLDEPAAFSNPHVSLEIDTEQTVTKDSRIELADELDPLGRPRASVRWTISETDCRTAYVTAKAFGDFARSHGLGTLDLAPGLRLDNVAFDARRDSNHQLGGTRMSETPATGVVNRDLRVHGVPNLSVIGGSVFSTGGHANPTQAIVALALRLADCLDAET
ncbi:MAG: GMC oxidoreductase [Pseudomonadota bacterium]